MAVGTVSIAATVDISTAELMKMTREDQAEEPPVVLQ
jgi:hypothetical protein